MKVELRLFKNFDCDLLSFSASPVLLKEAIKEVVRCAARNKPVRVTVALMFNQWYDEEITTSSQRISVSIADERSVAYLENVLPGKRSALIKLLLRQGLANNPFTPNASCMFLKPEFREAYLQYPGVNAPINTNSISSAHQIADLESVSTSNNERKYRITAKPKSAAQDIDTSDDDDTDIPDTPIQSINKTSYLAEVNKLNIEELERNVIDVSRIEIENDDDYEVCKRIMNAHALTGDPYFDLTAKMLLYVKAKEDKEKAEEPAKDESEAKEQSDDQPMINGMPADEYDKQLKMLRDLKAAHSG